MEKTTPPTYAHPDDVLPGRGPEPSAADVERPRSIRSAVEWVVIVAAALITALLIKTFVLQAFYIPSASMEPTLQIHDRVLVNKLSYRFHEVHRGDIVVFKRPPGENDANIKDLIKRVVAVPGETVQGREGHVYINGRLLHEPYVPPNLSTQDFGPVKVAKDHYWVMGDNRGNSKDSIVFGPIARSLIVGRAFIRVWPVSSITLL